MSQCPICLESVAVTFNCCADKSHGGICKDCLNGYIEGLLNSSFPGTCPMITCPILNHQNDKRKMLLLYKEWNSVLPNGLNLKYISLAKTILAFFCGGCHALKNIDEDYETDLAGSSHNYLQSHFNQSDSTFNLNTSKFGQDVTNYLNGTYSLEEYYNIINTIYFPELFAIPDDKAWEIFQHVLKIMDEPERRANLHLRYLRDHPRIHTKCCKKLHCFRCKTKDFHEGKSCVDNASALDHTVVPCPNCDMSLAKGDGCDSVTCVCGKQFTWSTQKTLATNCAKFAEIFTGNLTQNCVLVLCSPTFAAEHSTLAKAFQTRHRADVNKEMLKWFKSEYYECPSKIAFSLPFSSLKAGVKEAADLWIVGHKSEVEHYQKQSKTASNSVFLSLYGSRNDHDIAVAALSLTSVGKLPYSTNQSDDILVNSAKNWISMNRTKYDKAVNKLESIFKEQFLLAFGKKTIQSSFAPVLSNTGPVVSTWNATTSNAYLTYTNNGSSVQRHGGISRYPAAFVDLTSSCCTMQIRLDYAPQSTNWMSFGLVKRDFPNIDSNGVGKTKNSWGITDDRSSANSPAMFYASGSKQGKFRKLVDGDVLVASVDTLQGRLVLSINGDECLHNFEIPVSDHTEYMFAATFANDHKATLLDCTYSNSSKSMEFNGGSTVLGYSLLFLRNSQHNFIYQQYRSFVRKLTSHDHFNDYEMGEMIDEYASKWIIYCGGTNERARDFYEIVKPDLDYVIGEDPQTSPSIFSEQPNVALPWLTWKRLMYAACWYRIHQDSIIESNMSDIATIFLLTHQENAPFVAAMALVGNADPSNKPDKDERNAALAFMRLNPDIMNEWYEYDAMCSEPMIPGICATCKCLPRHTANCSKIPKVKSNK
eukprot:gene8959-12080_t